MNVAGVFHIIVRFPGWKVLFKGLFITDESTRLNSEGLRLCKEGYHSLWN